MSDRCAKLTDEMEASQMNVNEIRFADRFEGVTGSAIREIFKLLARPGMISFAGGNPSESALPDRKKHTSELQSRE